MVRIGINGFGRIGRCALRIAVKNPEVEVVAVNARSGIDTYAHLLKYDTVHGTKPSNSPVTPIRRRSPGANWAWM